MKDQKLVFREELNEDNMEMNMRFYLIKGDINKGLELGNQLNTWPSFSISISNNKLNYKKDNTRIVKLKIVISKY